MRFHTTAEGDVPFTAEEEAERDAEIAAALIRKAADATAAAIAEIDVELAVIDIKRVRPLAEGDTVYLKTLNDQAVQLRAQRRALA